jgi:plasmid maintenance system antidote protein VapI
MGIYCLNMLAIALELARDNPAYKDVAGKFFEHFVYIVHVMHNRGGNELVNGRCGITPSTALRLAKYFGMSADFWMHLQLRWDLYHAQPSEAKELAVIQLYQACR